MLDHDNLDAFSDPEKYDTHENDAGVAFYTALAQETGGPVLELACGTGRVGIPIARLGIAVTGLDIVPGMLEQARRKSRGLPVRWIEGDARAFNLGERFGLIFLTGNAFQWFLTLADQEALLQSVRAHLHDAGVFAFETRNPLWATPQTRADREAILERARRRGDWFVLRESRDDQELQVDANGRDVHVSRTIAYDHVAQLLHVVHSRRWREGNEEQTKTTRMALRYTFPQELAALLHYNGFTIVGQYGDWNREPLTDESTSIIIVCRKRA